MRQLRMGFGVGGGNYQDEKGWKRTKKPHLIDDKDARTVRTADSRRFLGLESQISTLSPQILISFPDRRSFGAVGVVWSLCVADYIVLFHVVVRKNISG